MILLYGGHSLSPKVIWTRAGLALGAGLALTAIAIGFALTRSPPTVAWSDSTPLKGTFLSTGHRLRACQGHEVLPAGASAVRLSLYDAYGPRVAVQVLSGERVLTSGVRGAGWIGESPTVPLRPLSHGNTDVKLCFVLGRPGGLVDMDGSRTSSGDGLTYADGQSLGGRMRVEFLEPGRSSWWSLAWSVARRMGLGHWPTGTWTTLALIAMLAALAGGACWLAARELR
jgi:hypothetical protein